MDSHLLSNNSIHEKLFLKGLTIFCQFSAKKNKKNLPKHFMIIYLFMTPIQLVLLKNLTRLQMWSNIPNFLYAQVNCSFFITNWNANHKISHYFKTKSIQQFPYRQTQLSKWWCLWWFNFQQFSSQSLAARDVKFPSLLHFFSKFFMAWICQFNIKAPFVLT